MGLHSADDDAFPIQNETRRRDESDNNRNNVSEILADGRPTKIQDTIRLDSIWPGARTQLSKELKEPEREEWTQEGVRLQTGRLNRGNCEVPTDDKDYLKMIAEGRTKNMKDTCLPCHQLWRETVKGATALLCYRCRSHFRII